MPFRQRDTKQIRDKYFFSPQKILGARSHFYLLKLFKACFRQASSTQGNPYKICSTVGRIGFLKWYLLLRRVKQELVDKIMHLLMETCAHVFARLREWQIDVFRLKGSSNFIIVDLSPSQGCDSVKLKPVRITAQSALTKSRPWASNFLLQPCKIRFIWDQNILKSLIAILQSFGFQQLFGLFMLYFFFFFFGFDFER